MSDFRKYSKEFVTEFIELYKNLPSTWKIKSKEYSNREKKSRDYELLIEKLKEVEPNADRELVIKKINNMRSVYRRELKKLKRIRSGMGTDEVAAPNLWYFELLHFLDDQELPRPSTSTIDLDAITENNFSNDSTDTIMASESTQLLMPPPSPASSATIQVASPSVSPSLPSTSSSLSSPNDAGENNSGRRGSKRQSTKNEAILAKISRELEKPPIQLDRLDHVALSWTGTLKNLKKEQAIFAEKLINDVLFEAQLDNLSRNSFLQVNNTMQHSYPAEPQQQSQHHQYSAIHYPAQQQLHSFPPPSHQQQAQFSQQQQQIQNQRYQQPEQGNYGPPHQQPFQHQHQTPFQHHEQQQQISGAQSLVMETSNNNGDITDESHGTIMNLISNFNY